MLGAFAPRIRHRVGGEHLCADRRRNVRRRSGWLMTTFNLNAFDVSLLRTATTLRSSCSPFPQATIADVVDPRRMIIAVSYPSPR